MNTIKRITLTSLVIFIMISLSLSRTTAHQSACVGTPPTHFALKARGYVTRARYSQNSTPLRVREQAGIHAAIWDQLPAGTQFNVTDGPVCADAYLWWEIATDDGRNGWVAEGTLKEYFILPLNNNVTFNPQVITPRIEHSEVWSVAYSPNGKFVATSYQNGAVIVWNVADGTEFREMLPIQDVTVHAVTFSPDSRSVLFGEDYGIAYSWDLESGQMQQQFDASADGGLWSVAYSVDGKKILTSSEQGTLKVWDAGTVFEKTQLKDDNLQITCAAFLPNSIWIFTGGNSNDAALWDITTGKQLRHFVGHTNTINSVAVSPDGIHGLTGSSDGTVRLWSLLTGAEERQFADADQDRSILSVAYSRSGLWVVAADSNSNANVWEAATGHKIARLVGHTDDINSIAFSPDDKYVLTGSSDNTARLWDAQTGKEVRRFPTP